MNVFLLYEKTYKITFDGYECKELLGVYDTLDAAKTFDVPGGTIWQEISGKNRGTIAVGGFEDVFRFEIQQWRLKQESERSRLTREVVCKT